MPLLLVSLGQVLMMIDSVGIRLGDAILNMHSHFQVRIKSLLLMSIKFNIALTESLLMFF